MAPTTLEGQKTTTSPFGRDISSTGYPLKICEILSQLEAPAYIERTSVHDVKHILKTKKAVRKAIEYQVKGLGYCFVEVLSMCPTNWGMSPIRAAKWVEEAMIPYYPLGVYRDRGAEAHAGAAAGSRRAGKEAAPRESTTPVGGGKRK